MVLGWNEALWDGEGDAAPPSLAKDWVDLTPSEKAAATKLGYKSSTWEDDGCPE